jgi:hypothetical protein
MKTKLTAETQFDLSRGIAWFDRISQGLGDQFESEFYRALEAIKQDPYRFAADHTGYRSCRVKRFTAVIYFRMDGDSIVVVGLFTSGEDETALRYRS